MKKILLAAVAGGLIVFASSAVLHLATPLGEAGFQNLPNEDVLLPAFSSSIPSAGLYFFPGMTDRSKEAQEAWAKKAASGPSGMLLYRPSGGEGMTPRELGGELATNVLAAAIAAFVASLMCAPFGRRVLAILLLGVFAWLSISASHWIWYGFPSAFELAELIEQAVCWLLAGLAIAKIVPRAQG
ncbi:MAG TPA: hypothetical protein VN783_00610 [Thermoanaerobaculia bacterium]|nr:hypothetical protein [Thermoanaerobaculia bacterium]